MSRYKKFNKSKATQLTSSRVNIQISCSRVYADNMEAPRYLQTAAETKPKRRTSEFAFKFQIADLAGESGKKEKKKNFICLKKDPFKVLETLNIKVTCSTEDFVEAESFCSCNTMRSCAFCPSYSSC